MYIQSNLGICRQVQLFVKDLDVFRWFYIIVLKQGDQEAGPGFFISRRVRATSSRSTCWSRVDIVPPATVIGFLPCIKCSTDKVLRVLPHGIWNRSCIANQNDGQLSENVFHWENVKQLTVLLALIHDTGTAIQKPLCAKTTKMERIRGFLEQFRII